jgi:hypothetical protein
MLHVLLIDIHFSEHTFYIDNSTKPQKQMKVRRATVWQTKEKTVTARIKTKVQTEERLTEEADKAGTVEKEV